MNDFQKLASQLSERKFYDYAYKITSSKQDSEDLISEAVLKIHKNTEYFAKAYSGGYFDKAVMRCIHSLYIDSIRRRKVIDKDELHIRSSRKQFTQSEITALQKIDSDSSSNEYHKLLFRKVQEWGSVDALSKATGINKNTIYTGLRKYRTDIMNVKKLLIITSKDTSAVGYHRLLKPYTELKETRNDIFITRSNSYVNQDHDYVLFNRVCGSGYTDERAIMNEAKICGQKVIVDIDDYWLLPSGHILENFYKKTDMSRRILQNIKEADIVTCTNKYLADKISKHNKNVVILPNAININDQQWQPYRIEDETYRIGYVGSAAHTTDVPVLRKACNLLSRTEHDYKFIFLGWDDSPSSKLFAEVFTSRGMSDKFGAIHSKPITEYGMVYNMMDCALAPLADSEFNKCKSNLKILEASAHRLPSICSKIHPYFGSDFDKAAYFCESEYDWYKVIEKLIKSPSEGKKVGEAAYQILKEKYTYKQINKLRTELI